MTTAIYAPTLMSKLTSKLAPQEKAPKFRVQIDLPERSMDRLNTLRSKTESSSYAEVIKNALRLYEAVIEETEKGGEILIRDHDGNLVPYRVFV